jgi:hypothetical protein
MSFQNINTQKMHDRYEELSVADRNAIDKAYTAATTILKPACGVLAVDDRAEELVAALTHYVIRCRE